MCFGGGSDPTLVTPGQAGLGTTPAVSPVVAGETPPAAAAKEKPKTPSEASPEVQAARTRESRRLRLLRGRRSTILTGALGLQSRARVARKTLLGQ